MYERCERILNLREALRGKSRHLNSFGSYEVDGHLRSRAGSTEFQNYLVSRVQEKTSKPSRFLRTHRKALSKGDGVEKES